MNSNSTGLVDNDHSIKNNLATQIRSEIQDFLSVPTKSAVCFGAQSFQDIGSHASLSNRRFNPFSCRLGPFENVDQHLRVLRESIGLGPIRLHSIKVLQPRTCDVRRKWPRTAYRELFGTDAAGIGVQGDFIQLTTQIVTKPSAVQINR